MSFYLLEIVFIVKKKEHTKITSCREDICIFMMREVVKNTNTADQRLKINPIQANILEKRPSPPDGSFLISIPAGISTDLVQFE